jgi:hypothetical protein
MKNHVITVTFKNDESKCDPPNVHVQTNDIVQWKCDDGDLEIEFQGETPFTSTQVWRALRGHLTPAAVVKPGVPANTTLPRPTFRVNGTAAVRSFGDLLTHP